MCYVKQHKWKHNEMLETSKDIRQIRILEGHDSGSCFWIVPVKINPGKTAFPYNINEYHEEEISIDETDISEFLYYFLEKVYDPELQEQGIRDEYTGNEFEWNLEYNLFTRESIQKMMKEIEQVISLMESDIDNSQLDTLFEDFSAYTFMNEEERKSNFSPQGSEKRKLIKRNKHLAISFYSRFINRMEAMLDNSPEEYDYISFMGP